MQVREIMSTDVTVAETDTTLEHIATMMKAEDIGAVPVLDDDNRLCGIITDRDIVIRCIAEGKDAIECHAEDIISGDPETCSPDDDAREAARRMAERQIRRLPVVEDGKLVGMLSLGDIAVKLRSDMLKGDVLENISQGVEGEDPRAPQETREDQDESTTNGAARTQAKTKPANPRQAKVIPFRAGNGVRNKQAKTTKKKQA